MTLADRDASAQRTPPMLSDEQKAAEQRGYDRAIAEVVAWLRGVSVEFPTPMLLAFIGDPWTEDCRELAQRVATAIEAGEHKP